MSDQQNNFYSLNNLEKGMFRELADGISTHIFAADQSMVSVVRLEPNAKGKLHSHPQEQWSLLIEGSATRIQGGQEISVAKGDFWVAPGDVEHGIIAGPEGAVIFDIFAPARPEYTRPGSGFGSGEKS
ncbi:MAG: cupin domain-containing protein [Alphaproteobacteria bacterium]|nr:cupin domain-containing protein [Alphaproteobacteria bacterium]